MIQVSCLVLEKEKPYVGMVRLASWGYQLPMLTASSSFLFILDRPQIFIRLSRFCVYARELRVWRLDQGLESDTSSYSVFTRILMDISRHNRKITASIYHNHTFSVNQIREQSLGLLLDGGRPGG